MSSPKCKSLGKEGIPADVWQDAPRPLLYRIYLLLRERLLARPSQGGLQWRFVVLHAIAKERETGEWSGLRWIGCCPSLQKIHLRMIINKIHDVCPAVEHPMLQIIGFRCQRSCPEITDFLQELLFGAKSFGYTLFVAQADVKAAFDEVRHQVIVDALSWWQVPDPLIYAILLELHALQAEASIPGAGTSGQFSYHRGGP